LPSCNKARQGPSEISLYLCDYRDILWVFKSEYLLVNVYTRYEGFCESTCGPNIGRARKLLTHAVFPHGNLSTRVPRMCCKQSSSSNGKDWGMKGMHGPKERRDLMQGRLFHIAKWLGKFVFCGFVTLPLPFHFLQVPFSKETLMKLLFTIDTLLYWKRF